MWTPLGSLLVTTKSKIVCRCVCGREKEIVVNTILEGKSRCCRSCSSKLKMANVSYEERIQRAKKASVAAVVALKNKQDPYKNKYGSKFVSLLHLGSAIKQRCTNPFSIGFANYGGRGVEFKFTSVRHFAEWVADNIGVKPAVGMSIDRIDNDKSYEPGNLRWATPTEQNRNKRAYKRTKNGERIRNLKSLRPDLTYETLRLWILQGKTDEEILNRAKYARSSV